MKCCPITASLASGLMLQLTLNDGDDDAQDDVGYGVDDVGQVFSLFLITTWPNLLTMDNCTNHCNLVIQFVPYTIYATKYHAILVHL